MTYRSKVAVVYLLGFFLDLINLFIAVVDSGSFTAAAAASGQTKAVVSFNIRQLEKELGVTLLLRST
ncbi:helix-turn-helix domain-containing protein, partial [Salmonella enterica]